MWYALITPLPPLKGGLERGYAALTTRLRSVAKQKSPLEGGQGGDECVPHNLR